MKRLWIALALLAFLLASTLANSVYLSRIIDGYELRLSTAQTLAAQGAWTNASQLTRQVFRDWEERSFYFHILIRHTDTDAVYLAFREVQEYLTLEETDQYTAANARLIAQLSLLAEMEQLTLKNVL